MSKPRLNQTTAPFDPPAFRLTGPCPNRLAAHLLSHFQIRPGSELSCALNPEGRGGIVSVMRDWVRCQLASMASSPVDNVLVALEERLLKLLQNDYPSVGGEVDVPSMQARRWQGSLPEWRPTHQCHLRPPRQRKQRRRSMARISHLDPVQPRMHKEESA